MLTGQLDNQLTQMNSSMSACIEVNADFLQVWDTSTNITRKRLQGFVTHQASLSVRLCQPLLQLGYLAGQRRDLLPLLLQQCQHVWRGRLLWFTPPLGTGATCGDGGGMSTQRTGVYKPDEFLLYYFHKRHKRCFASDLQAHFNPRHAPYVLSPEYPIRLVGALSLGQTSHGTLAMSEKSQDSHPIYWRRSCTLAPGLSASDVPNRIATTTGY